MVQISEKQLEEFRELYYKKFGVKLSDQENLDKALSLVNLFKVILPEGVKIEKRKD